MLPVHLVRLHAKGRLQESPFKVRDDQRKNHNRIYCSQILTCPNAALNTLLESSVAGRTQGAHKKAGKSVRIREATKRKHHEKVVTSGYTYATLPHETHGRLGNEAKEQIRILADKACCHTSVKRSTFIRNLKTERSAATVKGNALVFQACISQ